jgi:hypothetical protein
MNSIKFSRTIVNGLLGGGIFLIAFSLSAAAQVKTQTSETQHKATKEVTVERGEIAYVKGNTVVVKMEDGELESFEHVPESTSFMVDNKPVNITEARVGMKLEKQTVKTTTPKIITTIETVTGKVWQVSAPKSVILTLQDGTNQRFDIPDGQKFMVEGRETDAWGLRKGMNVNVQKVTEVPMTVIAETTRRTGKMPPPPPEPLKAELPLLVVASRPAPPPPAAAVETAAAEPAPKELPKTASYVPLIGLFGGLFCAVSLTSAAIRAAGSRIGGLRS